MIIILQVFVSYFVIKMRHIHAIIRGAIIATIGVCLTFYFQNVWFTIIGTMIFAVGEMMSSPTLSSFIAVITPRSEEHTSELQSRPHLVCRLLLEKKNYNIEL